jgi:hypothetical protein
MASRAEPPGWSRPTLSFCITTRGPAARVQALVDLMRAHSDEVVLAVDRSGDLSVLDACADVADQRLTFDRPSTASALAPWLMYECRCDWILRLDDDEVPSGALLAELPALLRDRHPSAFDLRRRWLFPDRERYIAGWPWRGEFQRRLVRNIPGLWDFKGILHDGASGVRGESRLLDLPIYHCDLVLNDADVRRRKALAYEERRPGVRLTDVSVNALYVPEAFAEVRTEPVPREDAELIDLVLDRPQRAQVADARAAVTDATREDIAAASGGSPSPDSHRGSVELVDPDRQVVAGGQRHFEVLVRNLGTSPWPPGERGEPMIRVGFRWRAADTQDVVLDGRAVFTETLRPGHDTRVVVSTRAPAAPGEYLLEVDLVHEHVRWFGCIASAHVSIEAETGALHHPSFAPGVFDRELDARLADVRAERARAERLAGEAATALRAAEEIERTRAVRTARALRRLVSRSPFRRSASR